MAAEAAAEAGDDKAPDPTDAAAPAAVEAAAEGGAGKAPDPTDAAAPVAVEAAAEADAVAKRVDGGAVGEEEDGNLRWF